MGDKAWPDMSVHEVTSGGSSLTGMGVASGAGMHCALDRSAEETKNSNDNEKINVGTMTDSVLGVSRDEFQGLSVCQTWSNVT